GTRRHAARCRTDWGSRRVIGAARYRHAPASCTRWHYAVRARTSRASWTAPDGETSAAMASATVFVPSNVLLRNSATGIASQTTSSPSIVAISIATTAAPITFAALHARSVIAADGIGPSYATASPPTT